MAKAGVRLADAKVFMGDSATVGLVPAADVTFLVPAIAQEGLLVDVVYNGPLSAPIAKGAPVGDLVIRVPGTSRSSGAAGGGKQRWQGRFPDPPSYGGRHLRSLYGVEGTAS